MTHLSDIQTQCSCSKSRVRVWLDLIRTAKHHTNKDRTHDGSHLGPIIKFFSAGAANRLRARLRVSPLPVLAHGGMAFLYIYFLQHGRTHSVCASGAPSASLQILSTQF